MNGPRWLVEVYQEDGQRLRLVIRDGSEVALDVGVMDEESLVEEFGAFFYPPSVAQ